MEAVAAAAVDVDVAAEARLRASSSSSLSSILTWILVGFLLSILVSLASEKSENSQTTIAGLRSFTSGTRKEDCSLGPAELYFGPHGHALQLSNSANSQ